MKKTVFQILFLFSFCTLPLVAEEVEKEAPPQGIEMEERVPEVMRTKYETVFIKMLAILFLIAISAGFIVWLYRRFNFSKMHQLNYLRTIKVIEKRPLSPKTMLYLVEINGKQVMLAESQLEVRQVMEFDMSLERALAPHPEV